MFGRDPNISTAKVDILLVAVHPMFAFETRSSCRARGKHGGCRVEHEENTVQNPLPSVFRGRDPRIWMPGSTPGTIRKKRDDCKIQRVKFAKEYKNPSSGLNMKKTLYMLRNRHHEEPKATW